MRAALPFLVVLLAGCGPSLEGRHKACTDDRDCARGQVCAKDINITGDGPSSCEIPCGEKDYACPDGLVCEISLGEGWSPNACEEAPR